MQKIPYFSGRTKLNHFNSTMSALQPVPRCEIAPGARIKIEVYLMAVAA